MWIIYESAAVIHRQTHYLLFLKVLVKWSNKENLYEILQNGFTDQIWLLKQYFKEIKAYTGRGKMIYSDFLNDIESPTKAAKKVADYFKAQ